MREVLLLLLLLTGGWCRRKQIQAVQRDGIFFLIILATTVDGFSAVAVLA